MNTKEQAGLLIRAVEAENGLALMDAELKVSMKGSIEGA